MPFLELLLPNDKYEIHDFDERGVPEDADKNWRISEVKYWIEKGVELNSQNKNIVICGFVKSTDFQNLSPNITLILLDAQPEIIRERLISRYTKDGYFDEAQTVIGLPVNKFISNSIYTLTQMRKMFSELNCPIIDTPDLTPKEVAKKVTELILK